MFTGALKSEYTGNWSATVMCDRCRKAIGSAQMDKKPERDRIHICRACAEEMFENERKRGKSR